MEHKQISSNWKAKVWNERDRESRVLLCADVFNYRAIKTTTTTTQRNCENFATLQQQQPGRRSSRSRRAKADEVRRQKRTTTSTNTESKRSQRYFTYARTYSCYIRSHIRTPFCVLVCVCV